MAAGAQWSLTRGDERLSAGARLKAVVRGLTRANRRQVFVACAWGGLFWGLMASCAAVLVIRIGRLPYSAWDVVAWILGLALAAAAVIARKRCPDDLHVAILADLRLDLQQKLSTAWEFARGQTDAALAERLAVQAVKARLPAKPEHVFPLGINTWGRCTPVAASLLVLVSILDLSQFTEPAVSEPDEVVVDEGLRLRDYGRQMEGRARREGLRHSATASQTIQRLGSRMQSGTLSRRRALSRLRQMGTTLDEQRRLALSAGIETKIGPLAIESLVVSSVMQGSSLRAMLQKLLDGRLESSDVQALREDPGVLSRFGISPEELQGALDRFAAGDGQDLRWILETLSRIDQTLRDAEELYQAQAEVKRARRRLGDAAVSAARRGEGSDVAASGEEEGVDSLPGSGLAEESAGEGDRFTLGLASGHSPQGTNRRRLPSFEPGAERGGVLLKPESRIRDGRVFTSEARVLPRPGRATLETLELDARFTAQVEEVLSKEEYPLHYKEFIRRYFLGLSGGVPDDEGVAEERQP